jgi:hypothetical protein
LIISTELTGDISGGQIAYFAGRAIEGFARGCVPFARQWKLPPLYTSGVRFRRDPYQGSGVENFKLPNAVYADRWGDCDRLCIYRIWELLVGGEHATCRAEWVGNGVHVLVRRANNQLEDPSIILGA